MRLRHLRMVAEFIRPIACSELDWRSFPTVETPVATERYETNFRSFVAQIFPCRYRIVLLLPKQPGRKLRRLDTFTSYARASLQALQESPRLRVSSE